MQIKGARELAKVAATAQKEYEAKVLMGAGFKKLLNKIEDAALDGLTEIRIDLDHSELRDHKIYVMSLKNAGYAADIKGRLPLDMFFPKNNKYVFVISWSEPVEEDE